MLVTYPALFYYDDTDKDSQGYFIHFPDFSINGTQGEDVADAMEMASDWLGIVLAHIIEKGEELPKASDINKLSLEEDNPFQDDNDFLFSFIREKSFVSMVAVDVSEYLGSQEPVKKTLTIPRWADKLGRDLGLNFSKTLTDAIAEKKIQA